MRSAQRDSPLWVTFGSIGDVQDQVLGAGADADLGAPDAQTGAEVVAGVATGVVAP